MRWIEFPKEEEVKDSSNFTKPHLVSSAGGGNTRVRRVVDITAIHVISRSFIHVRAVRRKGCITPTNPSPHGGRGALPSEGGSPSDLLFLAGGGFWFSSSSF